MIGCFFILKIGRNHVKSRFAKKSQKISTHLLTVLIIGAIVQLEQRKRDKESEI